MEHEPDNLNWYKTSLMRIADDIGTPRAQSHLELQRIIKNAVGTYLKKEYIEKIKIIIKNTSSNSKERKDLLNAALYSIGMSSDDVKIISSILSPYE